MESEQIFISDLADEFVSVQPGKPFRLFKYGNVFTLKGRHTVSKDNPFKLPHFRPQIKLGSHDDKTASGGSIVDLEFRDDGVYAVPELTPKGLEAWEDGSFRFVSPEVIWEDSYMLNSQTGEKLQGPLIVGAALVHTPALGESTALYTYEQEQTIMTDQVETVAVPKDFWEGFKSLFSAKPQEEAPKPDPKDNREEFEAAVQERDQYKARIEAMEAEKKQAELYAAIRKEFEVDEFGASYVELGKSQEAAEMLVTMDEKHRNWVMTMFKALSAQIKESGLTAETGDDDPVPTTTAGFVAAVDAYQTEHKVDYVAAVKAVAESNPELYQAYQGGK